MNPAEYSVVGSVSVFTGIRFNDENPFSPAKARPLLQSAMQEIRQRDRVREIGVDPSLLGRGLIKEGALENWDFVRLARSRDDADFAAWPHFTLGLRPDEVLAVLILPNQWLGRGVNRQRIEALGVDGFRSLIGIVTENLLAHFGQSATARPWILLQQRRWADGRAAPPVADARLEFDPTTSLTSPPAGDGHAAVKHQPQWLDAAFSALTSKNSNLEMAVGGRFLYRDPIVRSAGLVERVIDAWSACRPFLNALLPEP